MGKLEDQDCVILAGKKMRRIKDVVSRHVPGRVRRSYTRAVNTFARSLGRSHEPRDPPSPPPLSPPPC